MEKLRGIVKSEDSKDFHVMPAEVSYLFKTGPFSTTSKFRRLSLIYDTSV